jgi:hypothetical protein
MLISTRDCSILIVWTNESYEGKPLTRIWSHATEGTRFEGDTSESRDEEIAALTSNGWIQWS